MSNLLNYKGIHPGLVLDRELKRRSLKQRPFALSIGEHPQTLNAITKGKRNLTTALALKIEESLNLEEGVLSLLQTYYNIRQEKEKRIQQTPQLSLFRKSLFWDTDFNKLNWKQQYKAIIKRIFERGNEKEKNELIRFYGKKKVQEVLGQTSPDPYKISTSL
ncbi:MAG: helix-turn-helix domain-containing protein [Zunongwangia sp.]|uniref:helix-turn-helix transcriptional regulator n=1 Tax=Zunongwangia sp. TaxID=1965325 RepID=UPI0032429B9B